MRALQIAGRAVAVAMFTAASLDVRAAIYFVSPTGGNDANSGSIGAPFNSISHAVSISDAGDTIYLRGGTYGATNLLNSTITIGPTKSGTAASPVNLFAYPGDATVPVLDFRSQTFNGTNTGLRGIDLQADYWHLKGFVVQYAADNGVHVSGSNNTLERLVTRQNQDSGLILRQSSTRIPSYNLVLNCDSYGNFDYRTDIAPGAGADGFSAKSRDIGPGNYFIGDRAYNNSDDGFDYFQATNGVTVINSQSFHNGVNLVFQNPGGGAIANYSGDGDGFKLGDDSGTHKLVGSAAWGNLHNGFDVNNNSNSAAGGGIVHGVTVYNSTAFNNGAAGGDNFKFDESFAHVLKNNISLSGTVNINASVINDHNSWNTGFDTLSSDFVSTADPATDGLFHPAGTGGDRNGTTTPTYPVVPGRDPATGNILNPSGFLQLKFGDHLVDAAASSFTDATGTAVNLSAETTVLNFTGVTLALRGYSGAAPDLGAFELLPRAGDFSRDGQTNVVDLAAMMSALADLGRYQSMNSLTGDDMLILGDFDGDAKITNADIQVLLTLLANGGGSGAGSLAAAPEPATVMLMTIGLIALTGWSRL